MKRVFKYELTADTVDLELPRGAQLLTVQLQNGVPMLWALVDDSIAPIKRCIGVYGTGHPVDVPGKYVATFQIDDLVFHVFDEGDKR